MRADHERACRLSRRARADLPRRGMASNASRARASRDRRLLGGWSFRRCLHARTRAGVGVGFRGPDGRLLARRRPGVPGARGPKPKGAQNPGASGEVRGGSGRRRCEGRETSLWRRAGTLASTTRAGGLRSWNDSTTSHAGRCGVGMPVLATEDALLLWSRRRDGCWTGCGQRPARTRKRSGGGAARRAMINEVSLDVASAYAALSDEFTPTPTPSARSAWRGVFLRLQG